ncbi:MAG: hypothetical protein AB1384_10995 [Actinomycetota bacterium]
MALKRCGECGLPLRLSRNYDWPGNGVILARNDPTMRMVLFEADYYTRLWSELEQLLGVNISEAMLRGQQAATRDYIEDNILYGWRKFVIGLLPMRLAFKSIVGELALFGFGHMQLEEYRRGKLMVFRVRHPFDIISIAWGTKGLLEFVEGMGSELAWRKEGDDYIISILLQPEKKHWAEVDVEAMRSIREAKRELSLAGRLIPPHGDRREGCSSCGLPRALTELEWREDEGMICRRDNNRRFVFSTTHILLGVVRDLERKTGRDLEPLIIQVTKDYHLRDFRGVPIRTRNGAYRAAARYLHAGGFGNVRSFNCGEGYLEMTIENPLYVPRLVGRIAGLFEYVEGLEADISYRCPEPQLLELEIKAT